MGNLTQIITEKTKELNELKATIDNFGWFIEKGEQSSTKDVKNKCSLLVKELNKKYSVKGYTINNIAFDKIYFAQNEYNTFGIDLFFDCGVGHRGRVVLFQWNTYGSLEMSFIRSQTTPQDVVDLVYELYSNQVQKDVLNIVKGHIEPIRKLRAQLDSKRTKCNDIRYSVIKEMKSQIETMIENSDVITFDEPTYIKGFDFHIKSIQFVREPNRKLGVVKVEYQGGLKEGIITSDNFFNKKKHAGSIVDILHAYFYEITN